MNDLNLDLLFRAKYKNGNIEYIYNEYDNAYYLGNTNNPYLILVKAKKPSITSCVVNDKTRYIYQYAFYGCDKLKSVTIGNGVTSIGDGAFSGCRKLISITIPDSVTEIGDYAFVYCSNLKTVSISNKYLISDTTFGGCGDHLEIIDRSARK